MNRKLKLSGLALALAFTATGAWAQANPGTLPDKVDVNDVEVTEVRYLQFNSHDSLVVNAKTGKIDTLRIDDGRKVLTEEEFQRISSEHTSAHRIPGVTSDTIQYGGYTDEGVQAFGSYASLWSYKYPSVDANGKKVVLSALMGVPQGHLWITYAKPNNLLIGCHETITSNYECPTNYNHGGDEQSATGMMLEYCRYDYIRQPCCLVIIADYEGYGCTADRPHPYLYQELTARQVVDAVRYGLALYNSNVGGERKFSSFVDDWKSVSLGYSQGGSVALAVHKFIETNGLAEELHFAGSVCGDGPYDPVAHLRYYMEDNGQAYDGIKTTPHQKRTVSMPIVMPLILKGMCDSNPMMRQHSLDEYLTDKFFATKSTFMIEAKSQPSEDNQYSTAKVNQFYRQCRESGSEWTGKISRPYAEDKTVGAVNGKYTADEMKKVLFKDEGGKGNVWGDLENMLTTDCYNYFNTLSNFEDAQGNRITPTETERGFMQDLHRALESNNLTVGWTPQHRVAFYHSTYDTVVPYANLLSFMKNQDNLTYYFYEDSKRHEAAGVYPTHTTQKKDNADVFVYETPAAKDHIDAGSDFFFWGASLGLVGITPDYWLFKWVLTGDN